MGPQEVFNADTVKTKLIFLTAQLVYTLITLIPVPLLYTSPLFSGVYITLLAGWTVWCGAGQYRADFRERYRPNNVQLSQQIINSIATHLENK